MKKVLFRKRIAAAAAAATLAVAGGGATLAGTKAPAPVAPTSELYAHLLAHTDVPGFTWSNCPLVRTDARRWARDPLAVEQLRRDGFAAGVTQTWHSDSLGADAVARVAWFDSARGAGRALESAIAAARRHARTYTAFAVAGVPGARGFTLSGGGRTRHSVAFADGHYLHVVTVGVSSNAAKARVAAAAAALYRRVHGPRR